MCLRRLLPERSWSIALVMLEAGAIAALFATLTMGVPVPPSLGAITTGIQVNVDAFGRNILGDAANEASIAIDPTDSRRIVMGWRQFDVGSSLRQAGVGYSRDGGHHWTFPGALAPGTFGSDPVLTADSQGQFYYFSISHDEFRLFRSSDPATAWEWRTVAPYFVDKPWAATSKSTERLYVAGSISGGKVGVWITADDGQSFTGPVRVDAHDGYGTVVAGRNGELYFSGGSEFVRSLDVADHPESPTFEIIRRPFGQLYPRTCVCGPNGHGLSAQAWIATGGAEDLAWDELYLLAPTLTPECGTSDLCPWSASFVRSEDRGETWSEPITVNDPFEGIGPYFWFTTLSVAPNGRLDVVWNQTPRSSPITELYYSYSTDGGLTWSKNVPVSLPFDHEVGYPAGSPKLGDYYTMISDNLGANVAYAATFNGEQDVYFLRIGPWDCNGNEVPDEDDITSGASIDCNGNAIPDDCEVGQDADGNGRVNLFDVTALQSCFTAPFVLAAECCARFDADDDADVDLDDYAKFFEEFQRPQGPTMSATAARSAETTLLVDD